MFDFNTQLTANQRAGFSVAGVNLVQSLNIVQMVLEEDPQVLEELSLLIEGLQKFFAGPLMRFSAVLEKVQMVLELVPRVLEEVPGVFEGLQLSLRRFLGSWKEI